MARTWIILVNWNGGTDTVECLDSLLRLEESDFAVVIVDNGSRDGSSELLCGWVRDHFDTVTFSRFVGESGFKTPAAKVTFIETGANLGFAAANNLGMQFASQDPDCRFFWILNNDTVVAPDSLEAQRLAIESDPTIGMLGARLMFYHQPTRVQGLAGGFYKVKARGYHLGLDLSADQLPPKDEVERKMAYVLGASMFVRKSLVDEIGGMSEAYFLYFEELDWAERMPSRWRLAVAMNAVVWHKEGKSIGSNTHNRPSNTSLYYLNASLLRFYARHEPLLLPLAVLRVVREWIASAKKGDSDAMRVIRSALWDVIWRRRRSGTYGSDEFRNRGVGTAS
jgi:GT2 family glycosyltransferase